jgi:hypothetical protein
MRTALRGLCVERGNDLQQEMNGMVQWGGQRHPVRLKKCSHRRRERWVRSSQRTETMTHQKSHGERGAHDYWTNQGSDSLFVQQSNLEKHKERTEAPTCALRWKRG